MPFINGIEGVKQIKEHNADIMVLMHTVFDDDEKIFKSLAAGADGYLLKKTTPVQLYNALHDVAKGGSPMSPGIARRVLESFRKPAQQKKAQVALSVRETEILHMLAKGFTYKRIAIECGISFDTVRTHLKNIYTKLHVHCGTEAVAKALKLKIVDI